MDLTIGIVAYNALDKLRACLESIARQVDCGAVETIVVDNASAEPVAATVAGDYPWVRLLASDTNLGFAGGTNRAFANARGRLLLWLNPDTVLPTPTSLAALVTRFGEHPDLGALGCRLELPDGSTQPHAGRRPRWTEELLDLFHLGQRGAPETPRGELQPVEHVNGACLLTSAEVWRRVGPLDESFFMYLEDVDWCRRVAAAGYSCAVAPDITVIHHEGACFGERVYQRREHYWTSLLRYVAKHDGPGPAAALRAGLLLSAAPKWLGVWLADRSPARPARLALLARQLALGLRGA